jgi:hypothetical protein
VILEVMVADSEAFKEILVQGRAALAVSEVFKEILVTGRAALAVRGLAIMAVSTA